LVVEDLYVYFVSHILNELDVPAQLI
jgi:hypothetical protein